MMRIAQLFRAGALSTLFAAATLLVPAAASAQETACGHEPNVPFCISDAGLGQPFETQEELQECGRQVDLYRQAIDTYNTCLSAQANSAAANGTRAVRRYNCLITGATDCYSRYP